MSDLGELERMLREQLAALAKSYQEAAAPIIKRLVEIESVKPIKSFILPVDSAAAPSRDAQQAKDAVRDAISQALTSVYVCGRVWSAWQAGTMTEDDFIPAADSDEVLNEITDAAIAALSSTAQGEKKE